MLLCAAGATASLATSTSARGVLTALFPAGSGYETRRMLARDAALARSSQTVGGIPLAGDSMTYGEFDLEFLSSLLDAAEPQAGDTFVDCGSGCGRLVLGAALLQPKVWAECHGIELLPELHSEAIAARMRMDELPELAAAPIAPVAFTCADLFSEEAAAPLAAASVAFSYAVTWARDDEEGCLTELSSRLARALSDGARVISIDLTLRSDDAATFEQIAAVPGWNPETGDSTGYVYRVRKAR